MSKIEALEDLYFYKLKQLKITLQGTFAQSAQYLRLDRPQFQH